MKEVAQLGEKFRIAQQGAFHSSTGENSCESESHEILQYAYQLCCDSNGMICCNYRNDIRLCIWIRTADTTEKRIGHDLTVGDGREQENSGRKGAEE